MSGLKSMITSLGVPQLQPLSQSIVPCPKAQFMESGSNTGTTETTLEVREVFLISTPQLTSQCIPLFISKPKSTVVSKSSLLPVIHAAQIL